MSIMIQPLTPPFASRRHHPAMTAVFVVLFWLLAAALVMTAHMRIEPHSPAAGATAAFASLVVAAYCYTRLVAREAGISHALGVGITWLVLSITVEIALGTRLGHGWYSLLGSPGRPLLRNLYLFIWIFAPAFFAHGDGVAEEK